MQRLFHYCLVGTLNTAIHWTIFFWMLYQFSANQAWANCIAFLIAVTFSFIVNSRFTFAQIPKLKNYGYYTVGMATIATLVGHLSDQFHIFPLLTLIISSAVSLLLGFLYSKFFVFKEAL